MDIHHATAASEPIIQTAKVNRADPILPQRGRAHDARLHRHVEICFADDCLWVLGHDFGEGDEFGVAGALRTRNVRQTAAGGSKGGGEGGRTLSEAFVPLIPRPMTSPLCTKTQPTGVSSDFSANSAMLIASRMKRSWYSRLGMGPKTILSVVDKSSLDRGKWEVGSCGVGGAFAFSGSVCRAEKTFSCCGKEEMRRQRRLG